VDPKLARLHWKLYAYTDKKNVFGNTILEPVEILSCEKEQILKIISEIQMPSSQSL
jgi:hypothetical protein